MEAEYLRARMRRTVLSLFVRHRKLCFKPGGVVKLRKARTVRNAGYVNWISTISGLVPMRSGGPQVPAPLEVYTWRLPRRSRPYTNRP
jgi:hypothetical protein